MQIRLMEPADIPSVEALSTASFDRFNIVMRKLGPSYVQRVFLASILKSPLAFGVVAHDGDRLLAYAVAFTAYPDYCRNLSNHYFGQNLVYTAGALLKGRLTPFDLWTVLAFDRKVMRPVGIPAHFGPFAVDPGIKGTPLGGLSVLTVCRRALQILEERGAEACWGVVDHRNNSSQRLMTALGFTKDFEARILDRRELVYVKSWAVPTVGSSLPEAGDQPLTSRAGRSSPPTTGTGFAHR